MWVVGAAAGAAVVAGTWCAVFNTLVWVVGAAAGTGAAVVAGTWCVVFNTLAWVVGAAAGAGAAVVAGTWCVVFNTLVLVVGAGTGAIVVCKGSVCTFVSFFLQNTFVFALFCVHNHSALRCIPSRSVSKI